MKEYLIETPDEDSDIFRLSEIIAAYIKRSWIAAVADPVWMQELKDDIKLYKKYRQDIPIFENIKINSIPGAKLVVKTDTLKNVIRLYRVNLFHLFPESDDELPHDGYHDKINRLIVLDKSLARNTEKMESILTHELRHAVDNLKSVKAITPTTPVTVSAKLLKTGKALSHRSAQDSDDYTENFNAYLAEPHEVNARFTQVVRVLNKQIKKDPTLLNRHGALWELIQTLFSHYHISTVFPLGPSDPKYRHLLARIYKFVTTELSNVGKIDAKSIEITTDDFTEEFAKILKKIY
jgi:hypothetical protein